MTRRPIIDISQPLSPGLPVWPGDTPFTQEPVSSYGPGSPVNVSLMRLSTHSGAHADAPLHYDPAGAPIGDVSLEPYIGPTQVIDARGWGRIITPDKVAPLLSPSVERVLFRTWDRFPHDRWVSEFTTIAAETIVLLAQRGVILVGIDTPSIDPEESKTMKAHLAVRSADLRILEGLMLDDVEAGEYELIALPLRLATLDASAGPRHPASGALMTITHDTVLALDARDPLAPMRDHFALDKAIIYLDGNSLGALPRATAERLARAVREEWGVGLISSWNAHDWIGASQRIGGKIAPLIGARPSEVVCADSTSVNLFKLIVAALGARPGRNVVLTEPGNFPTDLYVASGAARLIPGARVRLAEAGAIVEAIDEEVAVVVLTHVHYKTGRKLDIKAITAAAHARGALVLWDLSHSTGAVRVDLDEDDVDLAVGCGYKYLNGGPGAPAFLFVADRLQDQLQSPLSGWMGHAQPFGFSDDYAPAQGIRRFLCGTPSILGLLALEVGVELFSGVDLVTLVAKSRSLSGLFIDLMATRCTGFGFELVTPVDPAERGSHVSYRHPNAYPICQALIARGVIGDFRAPDVVRFGFTPLYTSHVDVWRAVSILAGVMAKGKWDREEFRVRGAVT